MDSPSRLIFTGSQIQIGQWRCFPGNPLWNQVNVSGEKPMIVFPRSSVRIHQSGRELFVTSPNQVVFYNSHQTYRRAMASRTGDICEYVYLEPSLIDELLSQLGISPYQDALSPFGKSQGPCHVKAFVLLRAISKLIANGESEPLVVEDSFLTILPRLLSDSLHQKEDTGLTRISTIKKHHNQVETIKHFLNERYSQALSLDQVAEACNSSPFHISRVFKYVTKFSILQYLISLRLRNAFQQLIDSKISVAQVALNCGFSSQSHLSNLFRREFGVTPGFVRKKQPHMLIQQVLYS